MLVDIDIKMSFIIFAVAPTFALMYASAARPAAKRASASERRRVSTVSVSAADATLKAPPQSMRLAGFVELAVARAEYHGDTIHGGFVDVVYAFAEATADIGEGGIAVQAAQQTEAVHDDVGQLRRYF